MEKKSCVKNLLKEKHNLFENFITNKTMSSAFSILVVALSFPSSFWTPKMSLDVKIHKIPIGIAMRMAVASSANTPYNPHRTKAPRLQKKNLPNLTLEDAHLRHLCVWPITTIAGGKSTKLYNVNFELESFYFFYELAMVSL